MQLLLGRRSVWIPAALNSKSTGRVIEKLEGCRDLTDLFSNSLHFGPPQNADQLLTEVFRCQEGVLQFVTKGDLPDAVGHFRCGPNIICYGQCSSGEVKKSVREALHDAREHVGLDGSLVRLPFDPLQVVDNLRRERYVGQPRSGNVELPANRTVRTIYYALRPWMGVSARKLLQQLYFRARKQLVFPAWPVDVTVENLLEQLLVLAMKSRNLERLPFIWFWPRGSRSCVTITHDVETDEGLAFCPKLMDLDDSYGIKSSFQIVPEGRYAVSESVLQCIRDRGFEINVHDLNHDGHLFRDREQFLRRAQRINQYGRQYGALGFRSAVMYRNVDWHSSLEFSYDMSIPNSAHLDPQRGGCCTVRPFFVGKMLELPLTTTQDYSLFHILNDYSVLLWEQEIAIIREKYGLMSFVVHPDYIIAEKPRRVVTELLKYLSELRSRGETWIASPNQVAEWWRLRNELKLVKIGNAWQIEGKGSERAEIAYARLEGDTLRYDFARSVEAQAS
jgi:hypothetical protein